MKEMPSMHIHHIVEFEDTYEKLKNGIQTFIIIPSDKNAQFNDIIIVHKATCIGDIKFIDNKGNKIDNIELSDILTFKTGYTQLVNINNKEYTICSIKDNVALFEKFD